MMHKLSTMCPAIGGMWQPSFRWPFIQNFHLFKTTLSEDRFFNGILTSWSVVKKYLVWKMPLTTDDLLRQPLTWNFLFCDARTFLLGSCPQLNWAFLDASVVGNVLSWGCCRDSWEREREREVRQEKEKILYYEKTRLQRVGLRAKDWCWTEWVVMNEWTTIYRFS